MSSTNPKIPSNNQIFRRFRKHDNRMDSNEAPRIAEVISGEKVDPIKVIFG